MADGRNRMEWSRLSSLMALLQNLKCVDESHCLPPDHFNPYVPKPKKRPFRWAEFNARMKAYAERMKRDGAQ